jgi:hypothetical protein
MTEYHNYGVNLSKGQAKKLWNARKKGTATTIELSKNDLVGNYKLPLSKIQLNKIKIAKTGVRLKLSEAQLKHMERTGGFLPLAALIPLIISGIGAAGGVAGGVASAVSAAKSNAEQARHNRAIEEQLKGGSGVVSDVVGKIPVLGSFLGSLLQKIGLGIKDVNKIKKGGCVCCNGYQIKRIGSGLYLGPQAPDGQGVFLGPQTATSGPASSQARW